MNNRPATMTSMLASRPRRRGFSLVELLLSIFILAIGIIAISAIFPAAPVRRLAGVGHYCFEDAPQDIAGLIVEFIALT